MLSHAVGTLRLSSSMYRSIEDDLNIAQDALDGTKPRSAGAIARRTGRELGRRIEDMLDRFGSSRLNFLVRKIRERSGVDIATPTAELNTRFLRGSVEKFMDQAASGAADRAQRITKLGGTPEEALRVLAQNTRTVIRSGANAAHNAAVIAIARRNKKWISGVMALATLDNHTTELCIGRHGGAWDLESRQPLKFSTVDEDFPGRPPWHFNCRTMLTPVFEGLGDPEIQTEELNRWFDSADAEEAMGADRLLLFRNNIITREQLIEGL